MSYIKNPKVFISYAWNNEEYNHSVKGFADNLIRNGIEVILDQYDLSSGNDINYFIEKLKDPTVTNILVIVDSQYSEKANERKGGVGKETQLISPYVFNHPEQKKVIPIIFRRSENGSVVLPNYLESISYIDFTEGDYDESIKRLTMKLYGVEENVKPQKGEPPEYVKKKEEIEYEYDELKTIQSDTVKQHLFANYLKDIREDFLNLCNSKTSMPQCNSFEKYVEIFDHVRKNIRDKFLLLLTNSFYVIDSHTYIANFFKETYAEVSYFSASGKDIVRTFLHELFIYVVAYYLRYDNYQALAYVFSRTYSWSSSDFCKFFPVFLEENETFNKAISERQRTNNASETVIYWLNHINLRVCNCNEFMFADLICYNASIYIGCLNDMRVWYPFSYLHMFYKGTNYTLIKDFSEKLESKSKLESVARLFLFDSAEDFKRRFKQIEFDFHHTKKYEGFSDKRPGLDYPLLCNWIESHNLGIIP